MPQDFNLEAFLERVREFSFLYNKEYPKYKDTTLKEKG